MRLISLLFISAEIIARYEIIIIIWFEKTGLDETVVRLFLKFGCLDVFDPDSHSNNRSQWPLCSINARTSNITTRVGFRCTDPMYRPGLKTAAVGTTADFSYWLPVPAEPHGTCNETRSMMRWF